MVSLSLPRCHSALIVPALLPFSALVQFPSARLETDMISATDATHIPLTEHTTGQVLIRAADSSCILNGSVSHGTLSTFGQFNGYSQDLFSYRAEPCIRWRR